MRSADGQWCWLWGADLGEMVAVPFLHWATLATNLLLPTPAELRVQRSLICSQACAGGEACSNLALLCGYVCNYERLGVVGPGF